MNKAGWLSNGARRILIYISSQNKYVSIDMLKNEGGIYKNNSKKYYPPLVELEKANLIVISIIDKKRYLSITPDGLFCVMIMKRISKIAAEGGVYDVTARLNDGLVVR